MSRIFLPENIINSESRQITGEHHHQISHVLRCRISQQIEAVSSTGYEYVLELKNIKKDVTEFEIISKIKKDTESAFELSIYVGALKSGGLEEAIPQLVYLGVKSVIPVLTERTEQKIEKLKYEKRQRLDRIIERATALSGRTELLRIEDPLSYKDAISHAGRADFKILFYEMTTPEPLKELLAKSNFKDCSSCALFTGPEGGYTDNEVELAKEKNFVIASLGKRIFDAKTAPSAATAALMYEKGEL